MRLLYLSYWCVYYRFLSALLWYLSIELVIVCFRCILKFTLSSVFLFSLLRHNSYVCCMVINLSVSFFRSMNWLTISTNIYLQLLRNKTDPYVMQEFRLCKEMQFEYLDTDGLGADPGLFTQRLGMFSFLFFWYFFWN